MSAINGMNVVTLDVLMGMVVQRKVGDVLYGSGWNVCGVVHQLEKWNLMDTVVNP